MPSVLVPEYYLQSFAQAPSWPQMLQSLGPESLMKSTLAALLRCHPGLSLDQLHQWLDEAYCQWRDRELGPERYDPLENLPLADSTAGSADPRSADSPAGIDWDLI